ncbi:MAG TPA: tetratricopeptide repeat protein [Gammaproteobacteria bacterium]|nr:tetratricopeptide repeat protein [Gammaproteobacteria bacterium]
MSLLLDALKKAAEQKAQKRKSEASPEHTSDETLLDVAADDASRQAVSGDNSARQAGDDETEFDQSELGARLARSGGEYGTGDETSLDAPDTIVTRVSHSRPGGSTDDETGLELPDATKTSLPQDLPARSVGDETSLDIPGSEETESSGGDDLRAHRQAEDDETIIFAPADATELRIEPGPVVEDQSAREDETDLSQLVAEDGLIEDREPSVDNAAAGDETDLGQPLQSSDAADGKEAADDDALVDEDLSLLLIEREAINPGLAESTSFTDPQTPQDRALALEAMDPGAEQELSLVDSTQTRVPEEPSDTESPTLTNPTATALYADDTRGSQATSTTSRADSTSTRTYAPDNYDRTLMRLPSDDASKIFAGMKSDSDVVMTPDYAKKVFRSKTSAQRVQHYRLYSLVAVVLVLSVVFYGFFEYQDQSEQIDSSLRSLKRDPMPGVIKTPQAEKSELFAETDTLGNARTVEIIQSANQAASNPEVEEEAAQAEVNDAAPVSQPETKTAESEPVPGESQPVPVPAQQPPARADDTDRVASLTSSAPGASGTDASQNMSITTNSQFRQTDLWLHEAYAAYRAGDNERALSLYNQVLKVDADNRNALLARAAIHMQEGNIDAAIRDYQTLLVANPKDSMAMSSLLAVSSYSPQETESQLKLMIREEPDSPYLNFALANAYGAQQRWQDAQRHYFMALQNNPNDPNYAYNLAVSLEHISQPQSAITYYQRALENFTNGLATFNRDVVNQRLEILGKL